MTVWYTSQLGWTSSQNVSNEFKSALASKFKAGDTLVVDGNYDISGSYISLPKNFTMVGENGGGFNVLTEPLDRSALFVLGDGTSIENMQFTANGTPDSNNFSHALPQVGEQYHGKNILTVKGDNVTISDSSFSGNVGRHVDVSESKNVTIERTEFEGGFYQVRAVGGSDNFSVIDSYFHDSLGDGIKTERFNGDGPVNMTIKGSLFYNNNRDGLDTTGGFQGGSVTDSVFYGNSVSAMDLKKPVWSTDDLSWETQLANVTLDNNKFIFDSGTALIFTMNDRVGLLSADNAAQLMPHDISITNSTFESDSTHNAFLVKDGYNITWEGLTFYGGLSEARIMNINASKLSGWTSSNVGGEYTDGGAALNKPVSHYWSKDVGPSQTHGLTLEESVSDPIEEENIFDEPVEEPEAEPVVTPPSEPVQDQIDGEDHGSVGSKLLDISGQLTMDGSQSKVIELAPTDDLKTDAATIAFKFNANTVQANMGLVSRDAGGSDAGSGHFTSYIKAGAFYVRYQNGSEEHIFKLGGLKAERTYDVKTSFGDGKVGLWVDGVLIGEESMNMSWLTNNEYLQIGANGWASASGQSGFRDVFKGTIADVEILTGYNSTHATPVTEEPEPDPVVEEPVVVIEEPTPIPEPRIYVDPITGDNVLDEFEQEAITVTGRTEHMDDGSWVNVVLWHGPSNYSFSGSTQVTDNSWSLTGIDVSTLPAGEHFSVIATAQNDGGSHTNWTTFTIEEVEEFTHVFAHEGEIELNGFKNSVLEFQHTTDFALEDAAISFTFNADDVNSRSGLVSKDAFGRFQNDGHFTSYLHDGELYVRYQEGRQSETFTVDGIKANKDYTVTASFKDGGVALHVNGRLEQESNFDFSWKDNIEFLQIGANGWASRSGDAGYRDVLDGTIESVVITDLANTTASEVHEMMMQDTFAL